MMIPTLHFGLSRCLSRMLKEGLYINVKICTSSGSNKSTARNLLPTTVTLGHVGTKRNSHKFPSLQT
ncbi:hypothetical protein KC19_11G061500 [Ceratodon purpureus]|uniref:Uncharacterized protein n=1 Tax=Ceratodon purpureus TaxID=3225 RepID=A0A8T0GB09_CERPU|nr:hypothetical protein KC19_11G061500 [Ceratodon purpureus]